MWVEEEGVNVSRFGFGPEYLTDKDSVYYRGKKLE
jgi:hypothetical protein